MKPQTASWYCLEASFEYLIDPKCCLLSVLLHNMYQGRGNAYAFLNIPSDNKSILQHFISEKVEKKKKRQFEAQLAGFPALSFKCVYQLQAELSRQSFCYLGHQS